MFLPCLFPSLSSPNLIILRVSEYITLLKILLIYYIKFFNFGVAFSGLLSLIKILNINFNYFTMDKNIKDYITGMYNFLYDLHIDDSGTCMTGKELLSKMVSSHNTPYQNLWYRNFIPLLIHTNSSGYPYGFISPACPMSVAEKINILRDAQTILKSGQYYGLCVVLTEALQCWPKFCYHRGIKPLLPNVPALLSYHFPEFNKDRFAPSGISYDGYWWDKYDTDTRMKVLCELTDIYKEKLVGRSGPGEDELSE